MLEGFKGLSRGMRLRIILSALLVIGIAAATFLFSGDTGPESADQSSRVTRLIMLIFGLDPVGQAFDSWHLAIRKLAHFSLYTLLGLGLYGLSGVLRPGRRLFVSLAIGVAAALADELHQLFVSERSSSLTDVGIDSCGVLFGCLIFMAGERIFSGLLRKRAGK